MQSLEINELQFEKEPHTLLFIYKYCSGIIFEKSEVTPKFSFWISITLGKIYLSCIIINRGKNTFELVGTVLKVAAMNMYKYKEGLRFYKRWPCSTLYFNRLNYILLAFARQIPHAPTNLLLSKMLKNSFAAFS